MAADPTGGVDGTSANSMASTSSKSRGTGSTWAKVVTEVAAVLAGVVEAEVAAVLAGVVEAEVAAVLAGVELNGFGLWRTVDVRLFVLNDTLDFGALVPVGGPGTRGGVCPGRSAVPRGTIGDPASFHRRNSATSTSSKPWAAAASWLIISEIF